METLFPGVFVIDNLELIIHGDLITTIEQRLALYNLGPYYYLEGTFDDTDSSKTNQHSITINWIDYCRSASINNQAITYDPVMWSASLTSTETLTVLAYTDSVDDTGDYTTGICGEKKITLNVSTPSYLILESGLDPVLDNFSIDYDQANALESDIGSITV